MNRIIWVLVAGGAVVIAAGAIVNGKSAAVTSAAPALSTPARVSDPFHTVVGRPLDIPQVIPLKAWGTGRWQYSPDGTRLAIHTPVSIWVWNLDSNALDHFAPTADDESYGAFFHGEMIWTDDGHILALETQSSYGEVERRRTEGTLPELFVGFRWVLLDSRTGERIRSVADRVNADADGMLDVVGVVDADVWYIKARDGKLRTYDSRTRTVGAQAYFDYNSGHGRAVQIAPGSGWFSALAPAEPADPNRPSRGRLDVFNIQSGEVRRSVDDIYLPVPPAFVTSDAQYLFTTETGEDGNGVPEIYDLTQGIQVPVPAGERWMIGALSAVRGVLQVGVFRPAGKPYTYEVGWSEVPLSYLTQR